MQRVMDRVRYTTGLGLPRVDNLSRTAQLAPHECLAFGRPPSDRGGSPRAESRRKLLVHDDLSQSTQDQAFGAQLQRGDADWELLE